MSARLDGRTALVTGSTGGIGRAIAEAFAAEGAYVIVSGRRADAGAEVVAGIMANGGRATFIEADLTSDVRHFAEAALAAADGRIDILVNNAAQLVPLTPTAETTDELIDRALAVNIKAPIILTGVLAPLMVARGSGAVINIGSINASTGMGGSALYSTTKAAIHSLTRSWAAEYGASGVRVNTVAPGPTETEFNVANVEHLGPLLRGTASGRLSSLAEVAAAAIYLASDESSNTHGISLAVDGGMGAITRVTA
jgi:NAD(P)-dependent dehydrogenase (short-subunit alcohol dehydrogenase family)